MSPPGSWCKWWSLIILLIRSYLWHSIEVDALCCRVHLVIMTGHLCPVETYASPFTQFWLAPCLLSSFVCLWRIPFLWWSTVLLFRIIFCRCLHHLHHHPHHHHLHPHQTTFMLSSCLLTSKRALAAASASSFVHVRRRTFSPCKMTKVVVMEVIL